jgi:hypothetical protein
MERWRTDGSSCRMCAQKHHDALYSMAQGGRIAAVLSTGSVTAIRGGLLAPCHTRVCPGYGPYGAKGCFLTGLARLDAARRGRLGLRLLPAGPASPAGWACVSCLGGRRRGLVLRTALRMALVCASTRDALRPVGAGLSASRGVLGRLKQKERGLLTECEVDSLFLL